MLLRETLSGADSVILQVRKPQSQLGCNFQTLRVFFVVVVFLSSVSLFSFFLFLFFAVLVPTKSLYSLYNLILDDSHV